MTMKKTVAVFAELLKGPSTRLDLADKTDSNPKAVGRILNEMKALKMIYVIDYTNDNDGHSPTQCHRQSHNTREHQECRIS